MTGDASQERCERCGQVGEDRRTLWMACFYDMSELDIPFVQIRLGDHVFFTMRVCKDCRADWLHGIQNWFKAPHAEPEDTVPGFYVRDMGTTRLGTRAEYEALTSKIEGGRDVAPGRT